MIRGIVAVLFGIAAVVWPHLTFFFFVYLFAAFALVDGIAALVVALQERRIFRYWWVVLLGGIVGIILGLVAFFWPAITSLIVFYIIAVWAIVIGFALVITAFMRLRTGQEWALMIGGILTIILGIIMLVHPVSSILGIVWLIGLFAIVYGVAMIVRAFQFRSMSNA